MKKDRSWRKFLLLSGLVVALLLLAVFAENLAPHDPYAQQLSEALQPPSSLHWFGTDRLGRDLFSRVLVASTTSIFSTLALVAIIAAVGTGLGMVCGYYGGKLDRFLMRSSDIFLAFPGLVFALAVAALFQGGVSSAVFALAAISWPKYARLARGLSLSLREAPFVAAAKLAGLPGPKILVLHLLPNMAGPILVTAVLDIGTMMMELAALSFLGLGAKPPIAEWGSMMSAGRSMLQTYPWVVLTPGLGIFLTVVLFNLFGDSLRDVLDPRRKA